MKRMQACLSAMEDRESCFHHCGGPVGLVNDSLCSVKSL